MRTPGRRSRIAAASLATTRGWTHRRRRPTRANAGPLRIPHGACRVRRACWIAGNEKNERGAGSVMQFTQQATTMLVDNGTADGQSDAHATALGGEEGLEEPDEELPRIIVHADHRVRRIAGQVQDDLLQLDTTLLNA